VNGKFITCKARCESNWQVLKGKSHKAQCTSFASAILYSTIDVIRVLLKQKKSVAILCRHNNVANKLAEVFFEKNFHPRSVSDASDMTQISKYFKRLFQPIQLKQKVGLILVTAALCTTNKKLEGENAESLLILDGKALSQKRKPLLKQIYAILEPYFDKIDIESCLQVLLKIIELLKKSENIELNFSRYRFVEHCLRIQDITPVLVDNILMQRQYIDSFTNISPGLYVTTVHQSKGKEFDCVFVVDIDEIAKEPNLLYVANSRMKDKLYPVKICYTGVQYKM
jgi:superfamily I DNA/RNA helicase